jgi:mono/diheme cytochrome c family protein
VARGQAVYSQSCQRCHGADREGGQGPALGSSTLGQYRSADQLLAYVQGAMPYDSPGSLTEQQYRDVVAFLRQMAGLAP